MLSIVVAYGRNRVIGADGGLPWHLPSDLAHFKRLTTGHPVIMGRKTYESIPAKFRPLPGRRNLVLTENVDYDPADGAEVFHTLEDAVAATAGGHAFVIGGGRTYGEALRKRLVDRIYATEVDEAPAGDAFFPALGRRWVCVRSHDPVVEESGKAFIIREYEPADLPALTSLDVSHTAAERDAQAQSLVHEALDD